MSYQYTGEDSVKPKEYKHWPECNGDRGVPAGEPGYSCSCFNNFHAQNRFVTNKREETMKRVTLGLGFAALGFLLLTAAMIYHHQ